MHDHVFKALVPYRTDQTFFYVGVLPGRSRRRRSISDTQPTQASPHDVAIDGVSRRTRYLDAVFHGRGLGHLSRNPLGRWMRRYGW
jgi:hypothetical protein